MIGALDVFGLSLPWLMPLAALALLAQWLLRRGLAALGAYRWIWHPVLFDMALFVLLLWLISSASSSLVPA